MYYILRIQERDKGQRMPIAIQFMFKVSIILSGGKGIMERMDVLQAT